MHKGERCVAGLDLGSATTKAVILSSAEQVLSTAVGSTGGNAIEAGDRSMKEALMKAGLRLEDLDRIVTTGYGRRIVQHACTPVPEIICHAAGAHMLCPRTRTVIDIGGQDSKVIAVSEDGTIGDFAMNDKCAAGTGRFLELMAHTFHLALDALGSTSLRSNKACDINSTCAIFAETEVITQRTQGTPVEDLLSGVHKALSKRIAIMGSAVRFRGQVVLTGGVALNVGVKSALEHEIGMEIWVPPEPQLVGALGAALIALSGLPDRGAGE